MRDSLSEVFDVVEVVNVLDSQDSANLALLSRPDLGVTFTKLHCWRLTQFTKAVFMDADTLVVQNIDDLFEREEFSAAPDPGWPDCFNSGVFVYRPSEETYNSLLQFALSAGSFDGGDQGLLNMYFSDWATKDIHKHLPFIYNTVAQAFYSYKPALKQFGKTVRVIHFIGANKPWHQTYNPSTGEVGGAAPEYSQEFLQSWWKTFVSHVQPILVAKADSSSGKGGDLSSLLSVIRITQTGQVAAAADDPTRQFAWEQGQIDYLGVDKFENIQKQLDASMSNPLPPEPSKKSPFKL